MGKTSWNGQIYRALKAIDHTPALHRRRLRAVHVSVNRNMKRNRLRAGSRAKPSKASTVMGRSRRSSSGPSLTRTGWSRSIPGCGCSRISTTR